MKSSIEQLLGYSGLREKNYRESRPNIVELIYCPFGGVNKVEN